MATTERKLEVTEVKEDQVTIEFDGLEISLWRSSLETDAGQPVIQIDGAGMLRVNVNDYPIWNADPDHHEHTQCQCVREFEVEKEPIITIDGTVRPGEDDYLADGQLVEQIRLFDEGDGWVLDGANADGSKYSIDLFKYDTREEALKHVEEFKDWLKEQKYNLAENLPMLEVWDEPKEEA